MITRIWRGFAEFSTAPYFQGQVLVEEGPLKGLYKPVTSKYSDKVMAEKMLAEYLNEEEQQ